MSAGTPTQTKSALIGAGRNKTQISETTELTNENILLNVFRQ